MHPLSRDEALLLARELPHLRALQHYAHPYADTTDPQVAADRALLTRTLTVAQGHPKLIEIAEALAADPAVLEARVTAAETVVKPSTPHGAIPASRPAPVDTHRLLAALTGDPS
jgi:hypothetical protein